MKPPPGDTPYVDNRRVTGRLLIKDRRVGDIDRRRTPRQGTLKGGQIVWPTAWPVMCLIRTLSPTGATLEVHSRVPGAFELLFDGGRSRRSCSVVWRRETCIGVKFQ